MTKKKRWPNCHSYHLCNYGSLGLLISSISCAPTDLPLIIQGTNTCSIKDAQPILSSLFTAEISFFQFFQAFMISAFSLLLDSFHKLNITTIQAEKKPQAINL